MAHGLNTLAGLNLDHPPLSPCLGRGKEGNDQMDGDPTATLLAFALCVAAPIIWLMVFIVRKLLR